MKILYLLLKKDKGESMNMFLQRFIRLPVDVVKETR